MQREGTAVQFRKGHLQGQAQGEDWKARGRGGPGAGSVWRLTGYGECMGAAWSMEGDVKL